MLWTEKLVVDKFIISAFRFLQEQLVVNNDSNCQYVAYEYFSNFENIGAPPNLLFYLEDPEVPQILKRKVEHLDILLAWNHGFLQFSIPTSHWFGKRKATAHLLIQSCRVPSCLHGVLIRDRSN